MSFAYKRQVVGQSGIGGHNFVWRHAERPVYMMDNHGAALCCWLRELEAAEVFSIVHIDYHTDAGVFPEQDLLFNLPDQPSFEEFLALRSGELHLRDRPLVTWDNYLHALGVLRPAGRVFHGLVHQAPDGGGVSDLPFERVEWSQSPQAHMLGWVDKLPARLLINLDLDYFFLHLDA